VRGLFGVCRRTCSQTGCARSQRPAGGAHTVSARGPPRRWTITSGSPRACQPPGQTQTRSRESSLICWRTPAEARPPQAAGAGCDLGRGRKGFWSRCTTRVGIKPEARRSLFEPSISFKSTAWDWGSRSRARMLCWPAAIFRLLMGTWEEPDFGSCCPCPPAPEVLKTSELQSWFKKGLYRR